MTRLTVTGEFYASEEYTFTRPSVAEVCDAKATQLLRDFPYQFRAVPGTPDRAEKVSDKDTALASKPGKQ